MNTLILPLSSASAPEASIFSASPLSPHPGSHDVTPSPELALWQNAEVQMQMQMWQLIVENANDPVIVTTADLSCPGPHIVYVNTAFSRLTGYAPHEIIGLTPRILQGPLTNRDEMERMRAELESGRSFVGQTINYTKSGQLY